MSSIIIKKYPNRRLYNTQISSYIALSDLLEMVRKAIEFKVLDSKTKEDITNTILIQIIFDQEQKNYSLLPSTVLKHIINFYQGAHSIMLPPHLEFCTNSFSQNKEIVKEPLKAFGSFTKNNVELIENGMNMFYKSFGLNKPENK